MLKVKETLEQEKPVRFLELNEEEELVLKNFSLLTKKPVIYVANMDEVGMANPSENEHYKALLKKAESENAEVVTLCAKIEEDLSGMEAEEKEMFLADLGLPSSGLDTLIQKAYTVLDLCTFLTAGEDECRAWTFTKGMKAPQCAGVIHTDFERGFIRAEVYAFSDMDKLESEQAIKEAGKLRSEGKEYVMQDGDVVHFRFNV